jgi:hypothetical protein
MANRSRTKIWIDGKIQGELAIRVLFHWIIFAVVASVITLLFRFVADPFRPFSEQLKNVWRDQGPFLISILLLLPAFAYDAIKLSHRFAGPVLRLRKAFQTLLRGEAVEKLTFREGDFWKELADEFNALVEHGYIAQPREARRSAPTAELQEVS